MQLKQAQSHQAGPAAASSVKIAFTDLENYKLILKVMTSSDVSEVLDVGRGVPEELEFQIQMEAADGTIRYNRAQPYQQKKFRILTQ